jgi:hypothetical protein
MTRATVSYIGNGWEGKQSFRLADSIKGNIIRTIKSPERVASSRSPDHRSILGTIFEIPIVGSAFSTDIKGQLQLAAADVHKWPTTS